MEKMYNESELDQQRFTNVLKKVWLAFCIVSHLIIEVLEIIQYSHGHQNHHSLEPKLHI